MNIKKGDTVIVLSGSEKGKTGRVLYVFPKKDRIMVERVRLIKRHTKPGRQGNMQGGVVEKEAAIPVAKVAVVDPRSGKATRIRHQYQNDGSKIRVAARSGETIEKA
jgi:large subunit ribosomal protein L24